MLFFSFFSVFFLLARFHVFLRLSKTLKNFRVENKHLEKNKIKRTAAELRRTAPVRSFRENAAQFICCFCAQNSLTSHRQCVCGYIPVFSCLNSREKTQTLSRAFPCSESRTVSTVVKMHVRNLLIDITSSSVHNFMIAQRILPGVNEHI